LSASLARLRADFKPYGRYLLDVAVYYGLNPRVTSAYRSFKEQETLYLRRQRGEHPLPVAPPGGSMHNYGLAIDLVSDNNEALGRMWQSLGGVWGGKADPVHFAAPRSWRDN
jgi:hypothetical protein